MHPSSFGIPGFKSKLNFICTAVIKLPSSLQEVRCSLNQLIVLINDALDTYLLTIISQSDIVLIVH